MLAELLKRARAGRPLWLPDVRAAFEKAEGAARVVLRLTFWDGRARDYVHFLPRWGGAEERKLVLDYLCACIFNLLSVCGGQELRFFFDGGDAAAAGLIREAGDRFQLDGRDRAGLGRVVNIAERMGRAIGGSFSFAISDLKDYAPLPRETARPLPDLPAYLRRIARESEHSLNCVGIDIGGTDIKLAASADGRLVAVKEYDWNPAASATAEDILSPVLLLLRLMRACIAADMPGAEPRESLRARLSAALNRDASDAEISAAVAAAEAALGAGIDVLDAVGVSFPDIVLMDRVVGGETPKTDGIRRNAALDYETEFAKLGNLKDTLLGLCRPGGRCRITNDGNIAAFTAAVEMACSGDGPGAAAIRGGVVAHTLGTDLGTGWLDAGGRIPQFPLELYDILIDLGSFPLAELPPEDLRSIRNENSGLAGARRYLGQAAAWRLAFALNPGMVRDFVAYEGETPVIRMHPKDMRKECLAHIMALADAGTLEAEEVFRQIGRHFAFVSREFEFLLRPQTDVRFLFGRFVKSPRCFALLREGFSEIMPHIRLERADESLAGTALMRRLAETPGATVAQFGQAVGAICFALT